MSGLEVTGITSSIAQSLADVQADRAARDAVTGGTFENTFEIDITGSGETFAQINFTVRFVEKPRVADGWEMWPNQRLIAGLFPVISAGVFTWKMGRHSDSGATFFDGATIAINALNGPGDLHASIHLLFRGRAIRDPAGR